MKLHYQMFERPDHLRVVAGGKWRLAEGLEMIDAIGEECRRIKYERVLVDGSEITGEFPTFDRFQSGERVATACRGIRMVLYCNARYITRFGENVAVNRGAMFHVTADLDEAVRWLMSGAESSPPVSQQD